MKRIFSLAVRLKVKRFASTDNMKKNNRIIFKRPVNTEVRRFWTYVSVDNTSDMQFRLDLVPQKDSILSSLLTNVTKRPELDLAKNITGTRIQQLKI